MIFKKRYFILLITLLITLVSVASAADVDDSLSSSDATTTIQEDAQAADTQVIAKDNSNNEIKKTVDVTRSVTDKENSRQTRQVWNINNSNIEDYVTLAGLTSIVGNGDTLNFTENVYRTNSSFTVDGPVNIEGNGFTLDLNTIKGYNLPTTNPTYIEFTNGASNSNITNLHFNKTQVFTTTASNITFDNINVTVDNQGVGQGTGYFAMRNGVINITVKNSYFYAANNTGCSAIVITLGENCTIDNNTVIGTGKVGNLIYLNMYGATNNANGITKNRANKIINNKIHCVDGENTCWGITVTGPRNVIENNTINITEGEYGITTTWSGSYDNMTNPNDTHNVSYFGNTYRNNIVNGRFSTGNYSIVENNWINGTSTINGHAHVTNNTFLGDVTVHNHVRFHSNNATGQTVSVSKANSCFKDNTIYKLSMTKKAQYTYNCGGNNITKIDENGYENYFVPCNNNCPNCDSSRNIILSKKSNIQLKSEGEDTATYYTIRFENDLIIYNNGTAVIQLDPSLANLLRGSNNPYSNPIAQSPIEVTDVVIYFSSLNANNYNPQDLKEINFDIVNKENINLKIVCTSSFVFQYGLGINGNWKSVIIENFNVRYNLEDENIGQECFGVRGNNVTLRNCNFDFIPIDFITNYGTYVDDAKRKNAGFFVVGNNILIENCHFNIEIFKLFWNYDQTKNYTQFGIMIHNSTNVTFYNNELVFTSTDRDSSIDPLENYGQIIYGFNELSDIKFINNQISARYVPGINLVTSNSVFENNTIAVGSYDYTIELSGDNNIVRYNDLTSRSGEGDSTVVVSGEGNVVEHNNEAEPEEIIITPETYSDYFTTTGATAGTIIEGTIPEGSVVKFEGTFERQSFIIDIPLTIISGDTPAIFNERNDFQILNNVTIKNVQVSQKNSTFCRINPNSPANVVFENVTFTQYDDSVRPFITVLKSANITFNNCTVENSINMKEFVDVNVVDGNISINNSKFNNINARSSLFYVDKNNWNITVRNSNFTEIYGQNGAVFQFVSSSKKNSVLDIDNCIFENNEAGSKAGVIYCASNWATVSVTNSNFTNNKVNASTSGGSSVTDLAGVIEINNGNTNLTLFNNIMTDNVAANDTAIYSEYVNKIFTNAKLVAPSLTVDRFENVDLTFNLTDDMGNSIGFKGGLFGYTATINDEVVLSDANGGTTKTVMASYEPGVYPITLTVTTGDDKFDNLEILNGQLEVLKVPMEAAITITAPETVNINQETPVVIIAKDFSGKLLNNEEIKITVNNEEPETVNLENGIYIYSLVPNTPGVLNFKVTLTATEDFKETVKSKEITVSEDKDAIIEELNNTINEQSQNIDELINTVNEQSTTIDELNNTVQEQASTIGNLTNTVEEQASTIDELNNTVQEQAGTIGNLTNTVEEQASTIDELNNTVQELENTVTEQSSTINDLNGTVNSQAETITDLNNTVTEQNDKINELTEQNAALNNTINEQSERINNLEEQIAILTAAKATTIILDPITDAKYNTNLTISGMLINDDSIGLSNQVVTLTIGDKTVDVKTKNGVFEYTTSLKTLEEQTVTASYAGSDKYLASEDTTTFTIEKGDVIVTFDPIIDIKYGENVTITGRFTTADGKAISNSNVKITINGNKYYAKTDKTGAFTLSAKVTTTGENEVTIGYSGNANYNAYETTTTFNVEKQDVTVTYEPINDVTVGENVTITGTFTDFNGNAVKNSNVKIIIDGKKYYAKTDSNGVYTFTAAMTKAGVKTVSIGYSGNANYNEYTSETTFTVLEKA